MEQAKEVQGPQNHHLEKAVSSSLVTTLILVSALCKSNDGISGEMKIQVSGEILQW